MPAEGLPTLLRAMVAAAWPGAALLLVWGKLLASAPQAAAVSLLADLAVHQAHLAPAKQHGKEEAKGGRSAQQLPVEAMAAALLESPAGSDANRLAQVGSRRAPVVLWKLTHMWCLASSQQMCGHVPRPCWARCAVTNPQTHARGLQAAVLADPTFCLLVDAALPCLHLCRRCPAAQATPAGWHACLPGCSWSVAGALARPGSCWQPASRRLAGRAQML